MNEEGVEGLLAWWEAQPRRRRNDLELKTALIQRLIDCNDHESAYEFTLEIMKKLGDNTPISPEPVSYTHLYDIRWDVCITTVVMCRIRIFRV